MTDRLSALLHDGADHVDVPRAPATQILSRGRSLRRRGRAVRMGIGVAAVLVAATSTALLLPDRAPEDHVSVLAPAVPIDPDGWAVAQGSTIHLGSGATSTVPGKVKALYYTSAGVMARTGRTSTTDAADSSYFVLDGDGKVRDFALDLGDRKPGTDPSLPYLAYSVKGDDATHWELVLRDVRTGKVATRIPYEGAFTWGGWVAPPVALSGDYAYVGVDDATLAIAWRTGEVKPAAGLAKSRMPTVAGGRQFVEPVIDYDSLSQEEMQALDSQPQTYRVLDAETGKELRKITFSGDVFPRLSSDGRHVLLSPMGYCDSKTDECHYEKPTADVISVDTGASREFNGLTYGGYGWSPDGKLLLVSGTEVRACDGDTGACKTTPVTIDGSGSFRISGNDNES
jgi:hypothetical protein